LELVPDPEQLQVLDPRVSAAVPADWRELSDPVVGPVSLRKTPEPEAVPGLAPELESNAPLVPELVGEPAMPAVSAYDRPAASKPPKMNVIFFFMVWISRSPKLQRAGPRLSKRQNGACEAWP
jgi:hypothetical protein